MTAAFPRCLSACVLVIIVAPVLGLRGRGALQYVSFCGASQPASFAGPPLQTPLLSAFFFWLPDLFQDFVGGWRKAFYHHITLVTFYHHMTVINGFAEHLIFLRITIIIMSTEAFESTFIQQHSCTNIKGNASRYVSTYRC